MPGRRPRHSRPADGGCVRCCRTEVADAVMLACWHMLKASCVCSTSIPLQTDTCCRANRSPGRIPASEQRVPSKTLWHGSGRERVNRASAISIAARRRDHERCDCRRPAARQARNRRAFSVANRILPGARHPWRQGRFSPPRPRVSGPVPGGFAAAQPPGSIVHSAGGRVISGRARTFCQSVGRQADTRLFSPE